MMRNTGMETSEKLRNTIYGTLVFYFFGSPTYRNFLANLLGNPPALLLLAGQALLYLIALVGIMSI
jgi:hypothetical protein